LYLLIVPSGGNLVIPQSGAIYSSVSGALLNSGDTFCLHDKRLLCPGSGRNDSTLSLSQRSLQLH